MKKLLLVSCLILFTSIAISACQSKEFLSIDTKDYLSLYDYNTITVDTDYCSITDKTIENIITTELSVNEAYIKVIGRNNITEFDIVKLDLLGELFYYMFDDNNLSLNAALLKAKIGDTIQETIDGQMSEITVVGIYRLAEMSDMDFVLDYYNCSSMSELYAFIEKRAKDEIIYNYAYDMVCEKSKIFGYPDEIEKYIERDIMEIRKEILSQYSTIDEYFNKTGIDENTLNREIENFYDNLMINKAILDKSNIKILCDDIYSYRKQHFLGRDYSDLDVYYALSEEKVRTILVEAVRIADLD